MRMMIPVVRCDHCENDMSPEVKSAIVELTLPGQKPTRYSGENCDDCRDKFAQAVTELLSEYLRSESKKLPSVVTSQTGKKSGPSSAEERLAGRDGSPVEARTCPICRAEGKETVSVTRAALGQHLRHIHDTTPSELGMSGHRAKSASVPAARRPRASRLRDQEGATPVVDRTCPFKTCKQVLASRGGLSAHLRDHHDTMIRECKKQGLLPA